MWGKMKKYNTVVLVVLVVQVLLISSATVFGQTPSQGYYTKIKKVLKRSRPCRNSEEVKVVLCYEQNSKNLYYELSNGSVAIKSQIDISVIDFGSIPSRHPTIYKSSKDQSFVLTPSMIKEVQLEKCHIENMTCNWIALPDDIDTGRPIYHDPIRNKDFVSIYGLGWCPNGFTKLTYNQHVEDNKEIFFGAEGKQRWREVFPDVLGCEEKDEFVQKLALGEMINRVCGEIDSLGFCKSKK